MSVTPPEIPAYGGCPWPMDPACKTDEWEEFAPEVQERALAFASSTLQRLSGYRVGNCPITVRPQPQDGYCGLWSDAGHWVALAIPASVGSSRRRLADRGAVLLPAPIGRVDEVKVDGVVIDPMKYHMEGRRLVWHSSEPNPFPMTQSLDLPDTEPGTFSVTYLNAYPVDSLGAYAVGILAIEFAKACTPGKKCRLPDSVTSIVRQGVSMEIRSGTFPDGTTGIREVDAWIGLWNPGGLKQAAQVYSPDLHRTNRGYRAPSPAPVAPLDGGSF